MSLLDFSVHGHAVTTVFRRRIKMDPNRDMAMPENALDLALIGVGDYVQPPHAPFMRFDDYEDDYEDDFEEEEDFDGFSEEEDFDDDEDDDFEDDEEEDDDFEDDFDEEESDDFDYEDDIDYNDFDE
jgi:hypothetical protein